MVKNGTKIVYVAIILLAILMFIFPIEEKYSDNTGYILLIIACIPVMLVFLFSIIPPKLRVNTYVKKTDETIYYREIPYEYTPIIVSFLENLKMEFKKDVVSEILYLCKKGYIDIKKDEKGYIITDNKKTDYKNLLVIDLFVLKFISKHSKENVIRLSTLLFRLKYSEGELKACLRKDCVEMGLLHTKGLFPNANTLLSHAVIIFLGSFVVTYILAELIPIKVVAITGIVSNIMLSSLAIAGYLCILEVVSKKLLVLRTSLAKTQYSEWIAFADYLKDYGNLKDYSIEHVYVWDDYLTYAEVFNISKIHTTI